jgi:hypothetical protein
MRRRNVQMWLCGGNPFLLQNQNFSHHTPHTTPPHTPPRECRKNSQLISTLKTHLAQRFWREGGSPIQFLDVRQTHLVRLRFASKMRLLYEYCSYFHTKASCCHKYLRWINFHFHLDLLPMSSYVGFSVEFVPS